MVGSWDTGVAGEEADVGYSLLPRAARKHRIVKVGKDH